MKFKTITILLPLLILSLTLSACTGGAATIASSWPGLTIDGETAYVAYNQHVYAINTASGKEIWRFPQETNNKISFYAAPVLTSSGQLIVGGYDHVLYSLDPATGKENWTFTGAKNRFIGSPLVNDAGIFAPTADDHLYALDFQGKQQWAFQTSGAQWSQPTSNPDCKCIYLASMDHHIYAINATSGTQEWATEDLGGSMAGTPAYGPDGTLYIGTFKNEMVAVNTTNGQVRWHVPTDKWAIGGPTLKDNILYFGDVSGAFYAMDATNGQVKWKIKPDGPITQSPLLTDELIYFTTQAGSLYGVSYSGEIRITKPVTCLPNKACGKLHTAPALAGDKILVAPTGMQEILFAVNTNGDPVWTFTPEKK